MPPIGHVEEGETVAGAAIRETAEETGVKLASGQVRCVTVVHHRGPGGQARIGWFFAAAPGWDGEPANREPAKHSGLAWIDPADPPADLVAHTWAGLRAWRLAEMRRHLGIAQAEVAPRMGVTQGRVSAIEHAKPGATELRTLASFVEALGGRLEIIADFGDERLAFTQPGTEAA